MTWTTYSPEQTERLGQQHKLNYLAALIDELSLSDQEKLVAIMEAGCDEVSDIDDLINLTFDLDCYDIMPGINDESDLGYYYAHEAGIYSEKELGDRKSVV